MAENSKIQWTDHTFNSHHGCTKISPGCDNCYAERESKRFNGDKVLWGADAERLTLSDSYWKQPISWNKRAGEQGVRERVFCASMADVFDTNAPEGVRERLWALIKATPNLDWLILTKRIGNAKKMLPDDWAEGYANVWLMITVVNQEEADRDIKKLLETPAVIRGLSMEPLLGPVTLRGFDGKTYRPWLDVNAYECKIDFVITGGESGNSARPMHPQWVRTIRDQCESADVPFFFKQWGEWCPRSSCYHTLTNGMAAADMDMGATKWPCIRLTYKGNNGHDLANATDGGDDVYVQKVGSKLAGRLLDGVEHTAYPKYKEGCPE